MTLSTMTSFTVIQILTAPLYPLDPNADIANPWLMDFMYAKAQAMFKVLLFLWLLDDPVEFFFAFLFVVLSFSMSNNITHREWER